MSQHSTVSIPFSEPTLGPRESALLTTTLESRLLAGNGPLCREVESLIGNLFNVKHVLLTSSCTHALELAMIVLNIKPGDEVILPSFTFTSTANVILRQGATPIFVDIDPLTFNLNPERVKDAITQATRCIIPVHYAGQGCDMEELNDIAASCDAAVVEDAAHAIGAYWNGKPLGTLGTMGCFSFHATKNLTCGEGGALLTNDSNLAKRAEIVREKGTDRDAYFRGEIDRYTWQDIGSSFVLSDLLAAILKVQLERIEELTSKRLAIWSLYYEELADLEHDGLITRPVILPGAIHNGHIFPIIVNHGRRDHVIRQLAEKGVQCSFHYVPLHSSPFMSRYLGANIPQLPETDRVSASLLRLPLYAHLPINDAHRVVQLLSGALKGI